MEIVFIRTAENLGLKSLSERRFGIFEEEKPSGLQSLLNPKNSLKIVRFGT